MTVSVAVVGSGMGAYDTDKLASLVPFNSLLFQPGAWCPKLYISFCVSPPSAEPVNQEMVLRVDV